MQKLLTVITFGLAALSFTVQADVITGTVTDASTNAPISMVSVSTGTVPPATALTDASVAFSLNTSSTAIRSTPYQGRPGISWLPANGTFSWDGYPDGVSIRISDMRGTLVAQYDAPKTEAASTFTVLDLQQGIFVASVKAEGWMVQYRILNMKNTGGRQFRTMSVHNIHVNAAAAKATAADHVLTFSKAGYLAATKTVSSGQTGLQVKLQPQEDAAISFNPPADAYGAEQMVTITTTVSGATIRYTTDGSEPTATTGKPYAGPVKMEKAIGGEVINDLLSNASGSTLLKAMAFKDGAPASPVHSGIYEIMTPAPKASNSYMRGIAHVAYNVSNLAKARHFWKDYLGFGEAFPFSDKVAVIKINDQQYVELHEGPMDPKQYQLKHHGYQVSNVAAYRAMVIANGAKNAGPIATNMFGNSSFFSVDNDGHNIEFVEYKSGSMMDKSRGQGLPSTQIFGFVTSIGGFCLNQTEANKFYRQYGFDSSGGPDVHLVRIPNTISFYENGQLGPNQKVMTAELAGKKDQIDILNFRGSTIQQTTDILKKQDPSIEIVLHFTPKKRWVGNIYDPDGSRVELNDE